MKTNYVYGDTIYARGEKWVVKQASDEGVLAFNEKNHDKFIPFKEIVTKEVYLERKDNPNTETGIFFQTLGRLKNLANILFEKDRKFRSICEEREEILKTRINQDVKQLVYLNKVLNNYVVDIIEKRRLDRIQKVRDKHDSVLSKMSNIKRGTTGDVIKGMILNKYAVPGFSHIVTFQLLKDGKIRFSGAYDETSMDCYLVDDDAVKNIVPGYVKFLKAHFKRKRR